MYNIKLLNFPLNSELHYTGNPHNLKFGKNLLDLKSRRIAIRTFKKQRFA